MVKGGGKQKGAAFEREICKKLSLWLSAGEEQDLFWRSAMSGGRATVADRRGVMLNRQIGDISAISSVGEKFLKQVFIECKFYKNLELDSFMFNGTGKLMSFWKTAIKEAHKADRSAFLIAKQNRMDTLLFMDGRGFNRVGKHLKGNDWQVSGTLKDVGKVYVVAFDTFTRRVPRSEYVDV